MKNIIRWGILGCGHIAEKFASDLKIVENAELVAVGARNLSSAEIFAKTHSVPRFHGTYESLVNDEEVDIIYVATPHGLHHQHVILCLQHKKAVLCEKAFAINSKQAREMIEMAQKEQIFLMEALWSKFIPQYQILEKMIKEGALGKIKGMITNFGFKPEYPYPDRLYDLSLGGGSLLDIGVYCVFIIISILGRPDQISAFIKPSESGADEQCSAIFRYNNGVLAEMFSTFSSNLASEADIFGENGRIRLTPRFYNPTVARIEYYPGKVDSRQIIPHSEETGFGYQYQIRHVGECLRQGLLESPIMSHADTLLIMETLDRIRESAGLQYPVD